MSWVTVIVVYVIAWWLIFFMALPFGVRTPDEVGEEVQHGNAASAPVRPRLILKALVTTAIAAVFTAVFWYGEREGWLNFRE